MRRISIVLIACATLSVGLTRPAWAASYSWTGFYIGLNGGGAFGTTGLSHAGLPDSDFLATFASGDYDLAHNMSGWIVGGTFGYNWQYMNWVFGVESDFNAANISGTGRIDGETVTQRNGSPISPSNFVFGNEKMTFFGTARLRAGALVMPMTLLYATGGLAVGHLKYSGQFHYATGADYIGGDSSTQYGWTLGGGIEHHFGNNLSAKIEYLYYDLGKHSFVTDQNDNVVFASRFDYSPHGSIVRVGLNWTFGPP